MRRPIFLLLFFVSTLCFGKPYYGTYSAEVVRVIDGDTVKVEINLWPGLVQIVNIRLHGINTPEKYGKVPKCEKRLGLKATAFTKAWLANQDQILISEIKRGKYAGRILGIIKRTSGASLSEDLLSRNLAKRYSGGKRERWCSDDVVL